MRACYHPAAREEIREAAGFYERRRRGLGAEFQAEVRATVERIKNHPEAWHPVGPRTRRCRTDRFSYAIIYQVRDDSVVIVAVAHLHRKPDYWIDRL